MVQLTEEQYAHQKAECNSLCDIDHSRIDSENPDLMPCVTCPFCKEIVTAILTPHAIHCPACKITVKR